MTSNVNLDYSSKTTNFVWQQARQKSSQCLIFNIKKDQEAASESVCYQPNTVEDGRKYKKNLD